VFFGGLLLRCALFADCAAAPLLSPLDLIPHWNSSVVQPLRVPADEARRYADLLASVWAEQGLGLQAPQYVVLVDRSAVVQALLLYWKPAQGPALLIGAAPVSTGRAGRFDYFETPLGVFAHTLENPDFRAEGTYNENGIRGYGVQGMRVFDFGWQTAARGWGDGHASAMRLQMHATDPDMLEPLLGQARSKGCIRIPASVNRLLDHFGVLDADYERALAQGQALWMLAPDREPTPWSGRYLVVVQTERLARPAWAATRPDK
jgi:hypothetical protein